MYIYTFTQLTNLVPKRARIQLEKVEEGRNLEISEITSQFAQNFGEFGCGCCLQLL